MKIDRQMGIISHLVNQRKTTAKELSKLFKARKKECFNIIYNDALFFDYRNSDCCNFYKFG